MAVVATAACGGNAQPPEGPSGGTSATSTGAPQGEAGQVETLVVASTMATCQGGEGPRKCLQVKRPGKADFELFYSSIDGFTFEEGQEQTLEVRKTAIANPPADSSSTKYTLIKVVSKTAR